MMVKGIGAGAALALALLAGCGGGGGSGGDGGPTAPQPTIDVTGLHCSGGAGQGWCWQAPQPHGHWINDVAFANAQDGWAVGDGGLVLRTRDGGATWSETFLPGAPLLQAMRFAADGRQGWLMGADGGRLWRSTDGGSWVPTNPVPLDYATRLDLADNGALVVHGDIGTRAFSYLTQVSDDGGNSWTDPGTTLLTIDADGTQWHWLDNAEPGVRDIRLSTDGGKTFQRPAGWPTDRTAWQWESRAGGYAWVSFNITEDNPVPPLLVRLGSGQPWAPLAMPAAGFSSRWFDAAGLWMADGQLLWHADATGGAWSAVTPPYADHNSWGYSFVDGRTAWTREQMPSASAWVTADGGASWVRSLPFGDGGTYPGVMVRDGGGGLLINGYGDSGGRLAWRRSTDQGRNWTALPGARDPDLGAVAALWVNSGGRGLALTSAGVLLQTDDSGRHWQRSSASLPPRDPYTTTNASMQFTRGGTGWAFNNGKLYRSRDAGRTWSEVALAIQGYEPNTVQFIDDQNAVLLANQWCQAGTHDGYLCNFRLFTSADAGGSWQDTGVMWRDERRLLMLDLNRGVSAGAGGIDITADGGKTWQAASVPANRSTGSGVRLVQGAGALWLLQHHGLLRSTDAGGSWVNVDLPLPPGYVDAWPFSGPGLQDLAFADQSQGWIVGARGLVLATTDGGATWQPQASGTSTDFSSVFALAPKAVWIAGANGAILATATGGR